MAFTHVTAKKIQLLFSFATEAHLALLEALPSLPGGMDQLVPVLWQLGKPRLMCYKDCMPVSAALGLQGSAIRLHDTLHIGLFTDGLIS